MVHWLSLAIITGIPELCYWALLWQHISTPFRGVAWIPGLRGSTIHLLPYVAVVGTILWLYTLCRNIFVDPL